MKRFVRLVSAMLACALLLAVPAYAQEVSNRSSSYFSSYLAYCTKLSSTKVGVSFHVVGAGTMDEIGASQIKVQRSSDEKNWTTVKTFNKSDYSNMTDTDTISHGSTLSCTVAAGYKYRAYISFYAKNGTGTAYRYYYTDII